MPLGAEYRQLVAPRDQLYIWGTENLPLFRAPAVQGGGSLVLSPPWHLGAGHDPK